MVKSGCLYEGVIESFIQEIKNTDLLRGKTCDWLYERVGESFTQPFPSKSLNHLVLLGNLKYYPFV